MRRLTTRDPRPLDAAAADAERRAGAGGAGAARAAEQLAALEEERARLGRELANARNQVGGPRRRGAARPPTGRATRRRPFPPPLPTPYSSSALPSLPHSQIESLERRLQASELREAQLMAEVGPLWGWAGGWEAAEHPALQARSCLSIALLV
jgi:hypothetical protein